MHGFGKRKYATENPRNSAAHFVNSAFKQNLWGTFQENKKPAKIAGFALFMVKIYQSLLTELAPEVLE